MYGSRPDLRSILVMLFLIGTFGLNFPIFISTMAVSVFHADARGFGLLSSMMAIGTISGALLAAGRDKPELGTLLLGSGVFGIGCTLAAFSPGYWWFAAALAVTGVADPHLYKRDEQYDAALDQAHHARPGDGDPCGRGARGNGDGGSRHWLGGVPISARDGRSGSPRLPHSSQCLSQP